MEGLKMLAFKTREEADRREVLQAHKILIISITPPYSKSQLQNYSGENEKRNITFGRIFNNIYQNANSFTFGFSKPTSENVYNASGRYVH